MDVFAVNYVTREHFKINIFIYLKERQRMVNKVPVCWFTPPNAYITWGCAILKQSRYSVMLGWQVSKYFSHYQLLPRVHISIKWN